MEKYAIKQKIKEDILKIKADLKNKIKDVNWKEKLRRTRAFFKKVGKKTWNDYKKLPRKAKRAILIAVIALPSLKNFQKVLNVIEKQRPQTEFFGQQNKKDEIKIYNNNIKNELEKKYVISDKESFQKLYEQALPLIQLSMFPTECLALDPYSDNGKPVLNTIGLGSFYFPKNGDPTSSEWTLASSHFRQQGAHKISAELALDLVDGWFRYLDNGAAFNEMYKSLKGAELNVHEFAAIATVRYNSKKQGKALCTFVQKNWEDSYKCAQRIASIPTPKRFSGLKKRHLHEAYLYLNEGDYVQKIYDFPTQLSKSGGAQLYTASVMDINKADLLAGQKALDSANKDSIVVAQNKIFLSKSAQSSSHINNSENLSSEKTIYDVICSEVLSETHLNNLLKYQYKEDTSCFENTQTLARKDTQDYRDKQAAQPSNQKKQSNHIVFNHGIFHDYG